jgi:hypothetical protein
VEADETVMTGQTPEFRASIPETGRVIQREGFLAAVGRGFCGRMPGIHGGSDETFDKTV